MKYDLILHGCPAGQQFVGNYLPYEPFLKTFYIDYTDKNPSLFVEYRNSYMFYSYVVKDIKGASGRSGGYFAITLMLERFCSDISGIYNLLGTLFRTDIVGILLTPVPDGSYQFQSSLLSNFEPLRLRMEALTGNYLQSLALECFLPLTGFYPSQNTSLINSADIRPDSALNLLTQGARLDIAPTHPRQDVSPQLSPTHVSSLPNDAKDHRIELTVQQDSKDEPNLPDPHSPPSPIHRATSIGNLGSSVEIIKKNRTLLKKLRHDFAEIRPSFTRPDNDTSKSKKRNAPSSQHCASNRNIKKEFPFIKILLYVILIMFTLPILIIFILLCI